MNTRLSFSSLLLAVACCIAAPKAIGAGRPTPFPPGCVTVPERQEALYGVQPVLFWQGMIPLETKHSGLLRPDFSHTSYQMSLYRVPCPEPGRSVILVEFRMPWEWVDPLANRVILPEFFGVTGFDDVPFRLRSGTDALEWSGEWEDHVKEVIGDFTGGWWDPRGIAWRYVLDTDWPWAAADYYNSQFGLQVVVNHTSVAATILVPSTADLLNPVVGMPLIGRHSGIWVEQGANDQGFVLTFSNPVPPPGVADDQPENAELMMFLSWFTYDRQGRGLWLTANERFPQGAGSVEFPIVLVDEGEFLGGKRANRRIVGVGSLSSLGCNHLVFDYDLDDLSLGNAKVQLQRLLALEIDGYTCRDIQARVQSLAGNP